MGNRRQHHLNKAILRAVTSDSALTPGCFTRFLSFFQIFAVKLIRCGADYMLQLRGDIWRIDEKDYRASFGAGQGPGTVVLESVGDLGYSGSVRTRYTLFGKTDGLGETSWAESCLKRPRTFADGLKRPFSPHRTRNISLKAFRAVLNMHSSRMSYFTHILSTCLSIPDHYWFESPIS